MAGWIFLYLCLILSTSFSGEKKNRFHSAVEQLSSKQTSQSNEPTLTTLLQHTHAHTAAFTRTAERDRANHWREGESTKGIVSEPWRRRSMPFSYSGECVCVCACVAQESARVKVWRQVLPLALDRAKLLLAICARVCVCSPGWKGRPSLADRRDKLRAASPS